jgi:hypothetical protein
LRRRRVLARPLAFAKSWGRRARSRGYKFEPEVAAEMDNFFFVRIIIWSDFHLSEEDGEEEELGGLQICMEAASSKRTTGIR